MANFHNRKKSKRVTCRKKYKVAAKVREHHRKVRKEQKKKGHKKEKPIVVPGKCPFKEDILHQAEQHKQQMQSLKDRMRAENKKKQQDARAKVLESKRNLTPAAANLSELVANAQKQLVEYDFQHNIVEEQEFRSTAPADSKSHGLKTYAAVVKQVIENSDVIFEVLDARDPLGSRSETIERLIVDAGKRLVLLLNKIDLVPKDVVEKWMCHLRQQLPCIAFKASTQEQRLNIGRAGAKTDLSTSSSKCIGADMVMKLLGNYCRNNDVKTSINVGIVGFPNVGKSSVINSLKRKRTCNVGAMPGITKGIQTVELARHIRLVDSPGVVLASRDSVDPVEFALKNAVRVDTLPDPVEAVSAILRRCSRDMLMVQYNIGTFADVNEFLAHISRRIGKLKKGGTPDRNAAARKVLNDWTTGKLRYYTLPPDAANAADEPAECAQLVTKMRAEFNLDELEPQMLKTVQELPVMDTIDATCYTIDQDVSMNAEDDKAAFEMVVESTKASNAEQKQEKSADNAVDMLERPQLEGNHQIGKLIKHVQKKQKKKMKRTTKLAEKMAGQLSSQMELDDDDYDFDEHFPKS